MGTDVGAIRELWRYPVKSMRGERISRAEVLHTFGIPGDRAWAVRDEASGEIQGAKKIGGLLTLAARYLEEPVGTARRRSRSSSLTVNGCVPTIPASTMRSRMRWDARSRCGHDSRSTRRTTTDGQAYSTRPRSGASSAPPQRTAARLRGTCPTREARRAHHLRCAARDLLRRVRTAPPVDGGGLVVRPLRSRLGDRRAAFPTECRVGHG